MASPLPPHFCHDNDTNSDKDFDAPPHTDCLAATPQIGGSYSHSRSRSSSSSRHNLSPQRVISSSSQSQAPPIKPNSKSEQSREKPELPTTSNARDYNPISSQKNLTRYFSPAIVLQNSGSVARDHLASERTFLAYVRTSLGMASAGVALVQLFTISDLASKAMGVPLPAVNRRLQKFATPLGLSALVMALIVLLIGTSRYFLVQHALPQNKFPATCLPVVFISFGLGASISASMYDFGASVSDFNVQEGKARWHLNLVGCKVFFFLWCFLSLFELFKKGVVSVVMIQFNIYCLPVVFIPFI